MVHLYGAVLFNISALRFGCISLSLSLFLFLIKRLSTCHFNLVFSLPESLSVSLVDPFTWQILSCPLQRAKGCTAAEHHLRWEACYLNPRSRVPCLPFSWVLTADPDWCSPHAEANSAVKRTHFPTLDSIFIFFQSACSYAIKCVCLCVSGVIWGQPPSQVAQHEKEI